MFGDMFRQATFDPWREFARLQHQVDRLFNPAETGTGVAKTFGGINVWNDDETAVVVVALPGISPDSLDLTVMGKELSIRGTRPAWTAGEGETVKVRERVGEAFARRVALPFTIDATQIDAEYRNGMLMVKLPRAAAELPRKIQIRTASEAQPTGVTGQSNPPLTPQ